MRWLVPTGLFVLYGIVFVALVARFGSSIRALTLLPILGTAWLWGLRGASVAAFAGLVENMVLSALIGNYSPPPFELIPSPGSLFGVATSFIAAAVLGRIRDLEQQVKWQLEKISDAEACYRLLFESNPLPMLIAEMETYRFLGVNEAAVRHYGYSVEEFLARTILDIRLPEDIPALLDLINSSAFTGLARQNGARHVKKDGTVIDVELVSHPVTFQGTQARLAVVFDVTERKRAEAALLYQASHDPLTKLPNRSLLNERLSQAIAMGARQGSPVALMLIDLDRFKEINDTFGHRYGDMVLEQVNPRLRDMLRYSDTVARLGGDEFAILLNNTDAEGALAVAEKVVASLTRPFVIDGFKLEVGASIGIALYPDHGNDAQTLMQRADVAMYAAKRAGTDYVIYGPDRDPNCPRRMTLISDLRQGIEENQLILHYQPKLDLRSGRIEGVEALVRWMHPREGLMPPSQFIPLAEHTGLITPLSHWTLRAALRQARHWHQAGHRLRVAVNLPPRSLHDPRIMSVIAAQLEDTDALPSWLTVEITENDMMAEPARARDTLERLHELGIEISIDDFGTGHSSLAYLKDLPADEIKIDRTFVKDMTRDHNAATIVRSIIDLGHRLRLRVVAEGVEDQETCEILSALDCDAVQGYHFCTPLPPRELSNWIRSIAEPVPGL